MYVGKTNHEYRQTGFFESPSKIHYPDKFSLFLVSPFFYAMTAFFSTASSILITCAKSRYFKAQPMISSYGEVVQVKGFFCLNDEQRSEASQFS